MLRSHRKSVVDILGRGPIHPFPARMAPGIALEALGAGEAPLRVLDPMAGSGTVLAVARANGHRAFGIDIDPLSVLLARVWTQTVDAEAIYDKAAEVLVRAKASFKTLPLSRAYPSGADDETQSFVRYWFDEYARRQLTALATAISRVHDARTRDVLWAAFSRLIIAKSAGASLAMDLSHSRPHRAYLRAPVKPFNRFAAAVRHVTSNCPRAESRNVGPVAVVKAGDARRLKIDNDSIDLVLTSPPYMNAIDYMRCSKFSLVWMGYSVGAVRQIRTDSIGSEASSSAAGSASWVRSLIDSLRLRPRLTDRYDNLLARYVWDMGLALAEVVRVLRPGGRAVYVVGDSSSKGTFIPNSMIVSKVAQQCGLELVSRQARALPANRRYLPPPRRGLTTDGMDSRMRREVVLAFARP